jgi:hypothetical protein
MRQMTKHISKNKQQQQLKYGGLSVSFLAILDKHITAHPALAYHIT